MPISPNPSSTPSARMHPPKRVVLATGIYPPEVGGPATYVRSLARTMQEAGWSPVVVSYGDQPAPQDGWPVFFISRQGGVLVRYARYAFRVWKEARTADLIYVQGGVSDGFPATLASILAGKSRRLMMRVPGDYAWEMYQQKQGVTPELLDTFIQHRHTGSTGVLERMERWTAAHAHQVIAPSQYLKKIASLWGVADEKIEVIYSAVPPLPPAQPREETRLQNGWQEKTILFTAVRAVPWKGVDFLLGVLSQLPESHVLCVAGDGPLLSTWKELAKTKGLDARVKFLGTVDRSVVASWYQAADLFLLASGYEGFPHVVVEAVSAGLPCVVSDCGGNPETGVLFPQHVRVCPYQDQQAWKEACLAPKERLAPMHTEDFSQGAQRVMHLMEEICAS